MMATSKSPVVTISSPPPVRASETVVRILLTISFCHLLNDTVQSMIMAYYPVLKSNFHLTLRSIGLITLTYQFTASILQPIIGIYTDRRPRPFSLSMGMAVTTLGLFSWSVARSFYMLLFSAALVGVGSAIFHPEASRGGPHGFRRPAWPGPVHLPGGRQRRRRHRAVVGRLHRRAPGAVQPALFLAC